MLLGAAYAGLAIENSMLGAVHASANPLSSQHGMVHGKAVGVMMPWVIRFNCCVPDALSIYAGLARRLHLVDVGESMEKAAEAVALRVEQLLDAAGIGRRLEESGVKEDNIPSLSMQAVQQWTAGFNPRPVAESDFRALYRQAIRSAV